MRRLLEEATIMIEPPFPILSQISFQRTSYSVKATCATTHTSRRDLLARPRLDIEQPSMSNEPEERQNRTRLSLREVQTTSQYRWLLF